MFLNASFEWALAVIIEKIFALLITSVANTSHDGHVSALIASSINCRRLESMPVDAALNVPFISGTALVAVAVFAIAMILSGVIEFALVARRDGGETIGGCRRRTGAREN